MALIANENRTLQDALVEAGAVDLIMTALDKYMLVDTTDYGGWTQSMVWPTVPSCLSALWCLAKGNPAVQDVMFRENLIVLIVKAMKTYTEDDHKAIHSLGCATLYELATSNTT